MGSATGWCAWRFTWRAWRRTCRARSSRSGSRSRRSSRGLEHSVANMFIIPLGILNGAAVSWKAFLLNNLLPVTLGNIVGGAVCVATAFSYAYGKLQVDAPPHVETNETCMEFVARFVSSPSLPPHSLS